MRRKPARPEDLDDLISFLDIDVTPLPSPCIGICHVDTRTTFCTGCLRTIEEITEWGAVDDQRRRHIWGEIIRRRDAVRH
ncbi:MAG: DUF1289 domain-containing protein [Pseudomonadota bacterium]